MSEDRPRPTNVGFTVLTICALFYLLTIFGATCPPFDIVINLVERGIKPKRGRGWGRQQYPSHAMGVDER